MDDCPEIRQPLRRIEGKKKKLGIRACLVLTMASAAPTLDMYVWYMPINARPSFATASAQKRQFQCQFQLPTLKSTRCTNTDRQICSIGSLKNPAERANSGRLATDVTISRTGAFASAVPTVAAVDARD